MTSGSDRSSPARKWWLLLGAVALFAVAFDLIERIASPEPSPSADGSTNGSGAAGGAPPDPPEVRRLEDGGVEIRLGFFRRTTIRLENEEDEVALLECLEAGIDETFGSGTGGWNDRRVRREVERIQNECLEVPSGLPPIPSPTPPVAGD